MLPLAATTHCRVVAVDLPGAGCTTARHRSEARLAALADFLREFVDALELERLVLHGHSMGGLVGLLLADHAPQKVDRLILVGAPIVVEPNPPLSNVRRRPFARFMLFLLPVIGRVAMPLLIRFKGRPLQLLFNFPVDPAVVARFQRLGLDVSRIQPELLRILADQVEQFRARNRADAALTSFASVLSTIVFDQRPLSEAVDRIKAPTLVVWGAQDRLVTRPIIDGLLARRSDWQLETLARFRSYAHLGRARRLCCLGSPLARTRRRRLTGALPIGISCAPCPVVSIHE